MVRILTAHRVFPAKVTGGNGIAGTSVVPSYLLNNTPTAAAAAMTFLLHVELYKKIGLRPFLDNGVVVGPSLLESVGQQFDRLGAVAGEDQKSSRCCAESTYHPKNVFHCDDSSVRFCSDLLTMWLVGWMRQSSRAFVVGVRFVAIARSSGNGYTLSMDSVRFGRALGVGARAAAKTLLTAVDAAKAPNPSASAKAKEGMAAETPTAAASSTSVAAGNAESSGARLGQQAARKTAQVRKTGQGLREGGKRFGEAVWGPFMKLSGALWLELTGVFFGVFAVFAGSGAWKMRSALYEPAANHDAHMRFLVSVVMTALFGYFCVSSFVRANRRSRRR
jgi:hypothetical protein